MTSGDSRDDSGRARFFGLAADNIVLPGSKDPQHWYWKNQFYPADDGKDCCSDSSIAFHYVSPNQMHVLDFFAYKLKIFGKN